MTFESSPHGGPTRHVLFRHALAALLALGLFAGLASGARADDRDKADKLIRTATNSVRNYLVNPKWQAVRNLLGGARAIFLHIGGVGLGFEVGGEDESLAMVIMTDAGVDQLLDGVVRLRGSSGFALANLGIEGAGAGSIGS